MRQTQAVRQCVFSSNACWRTVFVLAAVLLLEVAVGEETEFAPRYALTVTTAESLRDAFLNNNVSMIYLGQDITLDKADWEDGLRIDPDSAIVVERNLTLTTHPSRDRPAILDLDYMKNRVLAGAGCSVRINGVVMVGVSSDARNYFFVPFFQFRRRGSVFIENSQYQIAIEPDKLWPLTAYPERMNATARPRGYEDWPVEAELIGPRRCRRNSLREVSCEHGAIFVESLSARLTVFDENFEPAGKAAFLARNVLMVAEEVEEEHDHDHDDDLVHVSTPLEFKQALQNPHVTEIHIVRDLSLTRETFPNSVHTPITRNLTIVSEPLHNRSVVINFNYLQRAVVADAGVEIKLTNLNCTRTSRTPVDFELVPFFSLEPGAMYVYRDIISEMAISPGELYSLHQLPVALYGDDVPRHFANVTNQVRVVPSRWCERDGRVRCPDGALWIVRGVRRIQVLDDYNQEILGEGFMDVQNTLIRVVDVDKRSIDPTEVVNEQEASERNVQSQGEEDSDDSDFMGGVDPWVVLYVLIIAAVLLSFCVFFTLWFRRKDHNKKKCPNASNGSSSSNDESGINAHQRVAQRLLGDVRLGVLLGRGSFGMVYKAMWSGAQVAVKVILHQEDEEEVEQEAQFSISLRHPNVVQTFHYAVRTVEGDSDPTPKAERAKATKVDIDCSTSSTKVPVPVSRGMSIPDSWMESSSGARMFEGNNTNNTMSAQSSVPMTEEHSVDFPDERWMEMWLIQEYCNLGSLGKQNHLRVNNQNSAWGCRNPSIPVIIDVCKDIARGMKYLHDNGIVHGDLKCDNILLQSSHLDRKGFTTKVADFGLSRKLGPSNTHLSTKSFGTITHMPPELLLDGHLSPKVDVYSFGVIMWEVLTGLTPFRDLRYAEVMRAIVVDDKRPAFLPQSPAEYVALAKRCWDKNPSKRPPFGEVLAELDRISNRQNGSSSDASSLWESSSDVSPHK